MEWILPPKIPLKKYYFHDKEFESQQAEDSQEKKKHLQLDTQTFTKYAIQVTSANRGCLEF